MKYFTYELIAAANGWTDLTEQESLDAGRRYLEAEKEYRTALQELKPRLSKAAWDFFENGYGRTGLHDGRLISFSIGDGLDYLPDGSSPFRINYQKTTARVVFLNVEQDLLYTFDFRGISRVSSDLMRCDEGNWRIGDLYTYEVVAADKNLLQLGFLFASGASIIAQFSKLVFKRQRLKRKYPGIEIYS